MKSKYCQHCGTKIDIDAEFCPKCGAKQTSHAKSQPKVDHSNNYNDSPSNNETPNPNNVPVYKYVPVRPRSNGYKYMWVALIVATVIVIGGCAYGYHHSHVVYRETHELPANIANQTLKLHGSDDDTVTYHTHYKTFTFKPMDLPTEKYAVEHVSKTDDGHKAQVQVQGLNQNSDATSFTFNDFDGELSAKPHGE